MADSKNNVTIHITGANPHIYPTAATVINYFGDKFAEDSIKNNQRGVIPNTEEEGKEDVTDELFAILQDKELYEETVKWAKTCKKPSDIKNRITTPLKRSGFTNFNKDFIEALLPHMTNYEGKPDYRTIQRALY